MTGAPSLAHDVYAIEQHDARHAWNLEDSLDFGWVRLRETGDASYFRWMLAVIHREAEALRTSEPLRISREGDAVDGPTPLGEKPESDRPA